MVSTGTEDTNVAKDIEAWKGIMNSGLPVYWMPTNPSKRRGGISRYVSYWHFVQSEINDYYLYNEAMFQFLLEQFNGSL